MLGLRGSKRDAARFLDSPVAIGAAPTPVTAAEASIPAGFPSPAADTVGTRLDLNEVLINRRRRRR
jgi:hypothetical protein